MELNNEQESIRLGVIHVKRKKNVRETKRPGKEFMVYEL